MRIDCPDTPGILETCKPDRATSRQPVVPVPSPPEHGPNFCAVQVETSHLSRRAMGIATDRFVRNCRRFVRATQIFHRRPLAALRAKPHLALQTRFRHRHRETCRMRCTSRLGDSWGEQAIYGRKRPQTCTNLSFSKSRFSTASLEAAAAEG